jgi:translocation and assembly module TamA
VSFPVPRRRRSTAAPATGDGRPEWRVVALLAAALIAVGPAAPPRLVRPARAADPLPYAVTIAPTGDATLDAAARDASTLISLDGKAPVGPFSLVARARGDVGRLTDALHSRGYYLGSVTVTIDGTPIDDPTLPTALQAAPASPPAKVVVTLTTGPLFRIGRVTLRGDVPPGSRALLGLPDGAPAHAADVLAAGARLLTALRDQGRALARVSDPVATLDLGRHALDIAFDVTAGPRVDLGPITFAGQTQVHRSYLRRRFGLAPGTPYNPDTLEHARQRLANVPALATVRLEPADSLDAAGRLPLTVVVTDRPPRAVDLTASYSTDQGGTASASWTHRNLFGNAEELRLSAAATQLGGSAALQPGYDTGATLTLPDWLGADQNLIFALRAVKESLEAYDRTAGIASVTVTRKLTDHLTVGAGLSGEIATIKQEDVTRDYHLIQLPLTANYDTTNSLLDPTRGVRLGLLLTPTVSLSTATTRESTFVIAQVTAATYLDVGDWAGERAGRSVVAVRGLAGTISGATAFDVPPDQRFYAGGGGTVRGYRFQSIGPTFPDGYPAGGTTVEVGSLELRQRIGQSLGVVAFVDGGTVSGGPSDLSGNGVLRLGAGMGVRYYTSFGPLRFDIGVPLDTGGDIKTDVVEAYIGIGQAF